ncbi:LOB domain-containing protein 29-like [Prunus yedoensis var. nudiflora]|uniref:LOB domain-containing protein 29-like n=1 Tax=Prunus yedoensis var. nudiflora TaxID=2094558 RepID=A0A314UAX6_PRUYE|nr:LOB domain-containing protein 29-like [Prunus yedoensis var. nudiflora]
MVFGASRISKLLSHLPFSDHCGAAMTIVYEAHASLEDPIYGCVSQIFALQQHVVNFEAQLASLHDQVVQSFLYDSLVETSSNTMPLLNSSHINNVGAT